MQMAQPHMSMFLKMKKAIKFLEENIDKLFDWFSDNFLKANPEKWHLLINIDESFKLKIKNETITKSSNLNVLGIQWNLRESVTEVKCSCKSCLLYELGTT